MLATKWTWVVVLVFFCLPSFAGVKRVTRDELSPAVRSAIDRECKGATIRAIYSEYSFRHRMYQVDIDLDGHSRSLRINPSGRLDEVEDEVSLDSLPVQVREALVRKAGGRRVLRVESVTSEGTIRSYVAVVSRDGKKREVRVAAHKERK